MKLYVAIWHDTNEIELWQKFPPIDANRMTLARFDDDFDHVYFDRPRPSLIRRLINFITRK